MIFTKKLKIPIFKLPRLNGQLLESSHRAKYLDVILNPKSSWKLNIENASGRRILWMYTAVVRPILTYGALVWWPALSRQYNIDKLKRIQGAACAGAT